MSKPMFVMAIAGMNGLAERVKKGICSDCDTPLTEYERKELDGHCATCHKDNWDATHPQYPDRRA